ncbi:hypothetical protein ACIRPN_21295 [Streptomyces sp. NPDC101230]
MGVLGLISSTCVLFLMPRIPAGHSLTFSALPKVFAAPGRGSGRRCA